MGVTLYIWKWASERARGRPGEVVDDLARDASSPALARFDVQALTSALYAQCKEGGEVPFELDVCDFTGHSCNWLSLSGSGGTVARMMPKIEEVARGLGAVVYDADHDQLVDAPIALEYAASAVEPLSAKSGRKNFDDIVSNYVAPAALNLGFKRSRNGFVRDEDERRCWIVPVLHEHDDSLEITHFIAFKRLAALETRYATFCQEPAVALEHRRHIRDSVREPREPNRIVLWDISGEAPLDKVGVGVADALQRFAAGFFNSMASLSALVEQWMKHEDSHVCDLALALTASGERATAIQLLDKHRQRVTEHLRTTHHPPSRSLRVEIDFLKRFLEENPGMSIEPSKLNL